MSCQPFRPRPSLRDLAGVARGPVQRAMLAQLVAEGQVVPDDWNEPGRDAFPHCRGWASYLRMVDRLRDALCLLGWNTGYQNGLVILEPITAASLRTDMANGVRLSPSLALIAYLYEPIAGAPIEPAVARDIRTVLERGIPGPMEEHIHLSKLLHAHP